MNFILSTKIFAQKDKKTAIQKGAKQMSCFLSKQDQDAIAGLVKSSALQKDALPVT